MITMKIFLWYAIGKYVVHFKAYMYILNLLNSWTYLGPLRIGMRFITADQTQKEQNSCRDDCSFHYV